MSLFATIAVVCTIAACSDYVVDHSTTAVDAVDNTQQIDNEFLSVWGNEQQLNKWLTKYQIGETVFEIVSVDFETRVVADNEIP